MANNAVERKGLGECRRFDSDMDILLRLKYIGSNSGPALGVTLHLGTCRSLLCHSRQKAMIMFNLQMYMFVIPPIHDKSA